LTDETEPLRIDAKHMPDLDDVIRSMMRNTFKTTWQILPLDQPDGAATSSARTPPSKVY
jgi:hypothetical protein